MRTWLGQFVYLTILGLVLALGVHLASILAVPGFAAQNADGRLAALAERHKVVLLPTASTAAGALPFRDPATSMAVCRYDLSAGPLRVKASTGDIFMSLGFHSAMGGVFYALTDRSAVRGQLDILVVTKAQLEAIQANDPEDEPVRELRLVSPQPTGFVTFRALAIEPGARPDAEALLSGARCGPEKIA